MCFDCKEAEGLFGVYNGILDRKNRLRVVRSKDDGQAKGNNMNWYVKVLKNYTVFDGRARRTEYWMFFLINVLVYGGLFAIDTVLGSAGLLSMVYNLAVFLPSIAVAVRRLHDTNRSGWWLLIGLLPIVGFIVLVVFLAKEGDLEENQFGSNPKAAEV